LEATQIAQLYRGELQRLNLFLYTPGEQADLKLVKWWADLNKSGDIAEIFHKQNRPLSTFIRIFQPPTITFISLNEEGEVNFAMWFSHCDMAKPAAFSAIWADESIRSTRDLFKRELICHLAAFAVKKHLFAVTRLKRVKLYEKTGYQTVGFFPGFYPDQDGILMHLNLQLFQQSKIYKMFVKEN